MRIAGRASLGAAIAFMCGCGFAPAPSGQSSPPTLNLSVVAPDNLMTFYESDQNGAFASAQTLPLSTEGLAVWGAIAGASDVDVYNIGPVEVGDHILADLTTGFSLDGAITIFDETGAALLINDHRNVYLGRSAPFVDVVIRRPGEACFLAVASTPGYGDTGDYTMSASLAYDRPAPSLRPDVVLLEFDGAEDVGFGSRAHTNVPPFDASVISSALRNDTDEIVAQVIALVRANFAGYHLTILSSSEGTEFGGEMSRIFFGSYDAGLLGVAEGVDEFNAISGQQAFIFTDTFAAFADLDPSVSEIAEAIANVATHEIGHLLGLVHTADPTGIMDVTASLRQLLEPQHFKRSAIHPDVFPIGLQDAPQILLDSVGGNQQVVYALRKLDDSQSRSRVIEYQGPPAREGHRFSSCCASAWDDP